MLAEVRVDLVVLGQHVVADPGDDVGLGLEAVLLSLLLVGAEVGADDAGQLVHEHQGLGQLVLTVDAEDLGAHLEVGQPLGEVALVGRGVAGLLGEAHRLFDLADLVVVELQVLDELLLVLQDVAVVVHAGEQPLLPAEDHQLHRQETVDVAEVGVLGEAGLVEVGELGLEEVLGLLVGQHGGLLAVDHRDLLG